MLKFLFPNPCLVLFSNILCITNPWAGVGGVPLQLGGEQDHLRQGGPDGRHHQLPEAQRPQRPAQRLVPQTELPHVAGQQDHTSHRQGGDDPQSAVKPEKKNSAFVFVVHLSCCCRCFFGGGVNVFVHTVVSWTECSIIPMSSGSFWVNNESRTIHLT